MDEGRGRSWSIFGTESPLFLLFTPVCIPELTRKLIEKDCKSRKASLKKYLPKTTSFQEFTPIMYNICKQRKLAELTFGHNYGREQQCQSEDCQDGVFAGMGGRQ